MILPFKQYFDKEKQKPTYFADKIIKLFWKKPEYESFFQNLANKDINFMFFISHHINNNFPVIIRPKIHTIRTDLKNRWKQGNKIHPVFNNRSKNQFQFSPTFTCKGIQLIDIQIIDMPFKSIKISEINGSKSHFLTDQEIELLAINDGFENITDFFNYFDPDFKGKIIHFTDYRY